MRLTQRGVLAQPLPVQAQLFWEDNAEISPKSGRRTLPMYVQASWQWSWRNALERWISGLPRR